MFQYLKQGLTEMRQDHPVLQLNDLNLPLKNFTRKSLFDFVFQLEFQFLVTPFYHKTQYFHFIFLLHH